MKHIFDHTIHEILNERLNSLEKHFKADVVFFYGQIDNYLVKPFRDYIEELKKEVAKGGTLYIILNTPGGSAETVEKLVAITRFHYDEVNFIVPDYAFSAGTIFCMSGDKIYMDYSSSLGPIDPQIFNGKNWVPALGYLDKVKEMIDKSRQNILTQAEFLMLKDMDLAMLRRHEQARDLTIALLKEWLVRYKFKDWDKHSTNPDKKGQTVTDEEKRQRAEEIARLLGDNGIWHSHGRSIGVDSLQSILKLKIEDYSKDGALTSLIRHYHDLILQYITNSNLEAFLHTRHSL